jgi:Sulfotransferase family
MLDLARDDASLTAEQQIDLHFALGKAFADLCDRERSFHHLLRGNSLMRRHAGYDETGALGRLDRIKTVFSAALMRDKGDQGDPSAAPIFVVGMPRSGTTLIEQIIASHPKVFGAGELRVMANLAEALGGAEGSLFPEAAAAVSGKELRQLGGDYVRAVRRLSPATEKITDKCPATSRWWVSSDWRFRTRELFMLAAMPAMPLSRAFQFYSREGMSSPTSFPSLAAISALIKASSTTGAM